MIVSLERLFKRKLKQLIGGMAGAERGAGEGRELAQRDQSLAQVTTYRQMSTRVHDGASSSFDDLKKQIGARSLHHAIFVASLAITLLRSFAIASVCSCTGSRGAGVEDAERRVGAHLVDTLF